MTRPHTFEILAQDPTTQARRGRLHTAHGTIETPVFMPVGTRATVKTVSSEELLQLDYEVILANTYHLWSRPGIDVVESFGGLHSFTRWPRAILTDSGGYQVFSLADLRHIHDEGVVFQSPYDGARIFLTPESVMDAQRRLGADIAMVLDVCPPGDCDRSTACLAVQRTVEWAARCARQPRAEGAWVFGIVQGAGYPDLRAECARRLVELDFDGYAIGGVSVGEPDDRIRQAVRDTVPHVPADRPRYVMGVGGIEQMLDMIEAGVDMFDCVMPTRLARHGTAFTFSGRYPLKAAVYARDPRPIVEGCACPACRQGYSRAYIRHLLQVGEGLGIRLLTLHNLFVYAELLRQARRALETGRWSAWAQALRSVWHEPTVEHLRLQDTDDLPEGESP
jgi:queuine tRNA-ribosyltransferase